jgi:hypothetical protein
MFERKPYIWAEEWPEVFTIRKYKYANLYPYAGRPESLQYEDAMWILAIELNYSL